MGRPRFGRGGPELQGRDLVALIGAETEPALCHAVALCNAFEHGTSGFDHYVQDLLAVSNLGDLLGKAAGLNLTGAVQL